MKKIGKVFLVLDWYYSALGLAYEENTAHKGAVFGEVVILDVPSSYVLFGDYGIPKRAAIKKNLSEILKPLVTVCRFAMGGLFSTNVDAEHETPPIANVLLAPVFIVIFQRSN